jgi:hypothetical protein
MEGIAKEIPPVHVVNVNVIGVQPCQRPWVNHGKPKTAVLKTPRSAREIGAVHVKRVATTKTGAEAVVGNPPVGCRRLCLSSLLLRRSSWLLRALLLLRWSSRLLRALLLLRGSSRLLCAWLLLCRLGRLLCAWLLLCRSRRLLRALLLLRRSRRLLRALLLLRRFGLLLLLLWLLLLFAWSLCVSGSNGGKQ